MAILFDQLRDFDYIYRYNGAFSANLNDSVTLDYFDDDASVGDYIVFGYTLTTGYPFHDLSFNVGTALATTSITVVWEYQSTSGWTAIPGVTDNTNAFQNAGTNTVTFTVPENWDHAPPVNGQQGYFVRCRISAVSGITEGGAQQTDKVQAKDWAIEVTGTSVVTSDIYDADQAGGWGVFTKLGDNLFLCSSNLFVGDGSTSTWLTLKDLALALESKLVITASAVCDAGILQDAGEKTTSNGADIRFTKRYNNTWYSHWLDSSGEFNIYGGCIRGDKSDGYFTRIYQSTVEDCDNFRPIDSNADFNRLSITSPGASAIWPKESASYNDLYVYESEYAIRTWATDKTITVNNFKGRSNTYLWYLQGPSGKNETLNLVNADTGTWDIYWDKTVFTASYLNRQYTVDIQVLDENNNGIQGATVTLEDKNGTQIFSLSTAADGTITQQTVTSHQYSWASGSDPGVTTDTDYNDFTLKIQKTGYQSIIKQFTLDSKVDWCDRLQLCCPVFDGLGG